MLVRVVKVGGSLFDLPDLADRLCRWMACQSAAHHVLVAGGGVLVEQVRQWHRQQPIDETATHWMCIDLMRTTARLLQARLPESVLTGDDRVLVQRIGQPGTTAFCMAEWLRHVEPRLPGTRLPCNWEVTSDAIAGRLAVVLAAGELVLLKSKEPPSTQVDLASLAAEGIVDPMLPRLAAELPPVRIVNLRAP